MSTIELDHEHGDERRRDHQGRARRAARALHPRPRWAWTWSPLDEARRARAILADVDALSDAALRTLAVAYRPLGAGRGRRKPTRSLERDLIFVGTVGIIDPPREEAAVAIREAHRAGIRVIMITGDHPRTAARIAADLGHRRGRRDGADRARARRARRCRLRRGGAHDLGLRARRARAQAAHRRRAAGRRQHRRDDRRRRQRCAGAEVGRHRHRHGRDRHRGHQGGGQDDPGRRQLRHHRRGRARRARHLRQHPQVPALPAVVEHGRGADGVPRRRRWPA